MYVSKSGPVSVRCCQHFSCRGFGTICPEVQRVWGTPQQAFLRALRPAKISECGHTRIACHLAEPSKSPLKTRKTKALFTWPPFLWLFVVPLLWPPWPSIPFRPLYWAACQYAGGSRFRRSACQDKRTGLRKCPTGWQFGKRYSYVQPFASLLRLISRPNAWKSSRLVSWYILISPLYHSTFQVWLWERNALLHFGSILLSIHILVGARRRIYNFSWELHIGIT